MGVGRQHEPSALFPDLDETEVTRVLERDGIYCGLRIQSEIVQAIHAFAETNPCFGNIDQNMPFLCAIATRSNGRADVRCSSVTIWIK
jgi:hypothetical protein